MTRHREIMSININVIVTGDTELVNYFRTLAPNIENVIQNEIDFFVEELKSEMVGRMHRRTGDMARSTRVQPIPNGKAVVVNVPYAEDENSRPGIKRSKVGTGQGTQHRYVEPSLDLTYRKRLPMLMTKLDIVLRG